MVTAVAALTALVVMLKVAVLALAGTVTVEDSCAAALLLARLTTAPPLGAALLNVRVPVEACPPVTADGLTLTDCNATADVGGGTTLPHHVLQ
jgi:hypothetical protein